MSARLSSTVSEFETEEWSARYDHWFREKVTSSLAKPGPGTSQYEVMAHMDAIIEEAERQQ